jgi:peptidoglycan hydrolase-like protein with peptidoglycan-binding domain
MKRIACRTIFSLAIVAHTVIPHAVRAQATGAAPGSTDAAMAAQKAAFLALPEATRKAAQEALVWLGLYNGVADADFGTRTRDAILAYQAHSHSTPDGELSAPELQALLAAAAKARDAVGFKVVSDPKTGARIGAPTHLLTGRAAAKLEFVASPDGDLAALYQRLTAATPTRKIAYKAMKPDAFFVVAGQEGATKFYSRFEKSNTASPPVRGFTFSYPLGRDDLDRIALAVADSFEAFPAPAPIAEPAKATDASQSPALTPAATALVVAPGKALTVLKAEDCADPTVDGQPVRFERADAAAGLALISGDFAPAGLAPRLGAPAPDLVVLAFAGSGVAATPASLVGNAARPLVVASLETSAAGAPVFDRGDGLVSLVAPIAETPKRVAGIPLAAPHVLVAPEAVRAFLGASETPAADSTPALSLGEIAAREKPAVVAVFCRK